HGAWQCEPAKPAQYHRENALPRPERRTFLRLAHPLHPDLLRSARLSGGGFGQYLIWPKSETRTRSPLSSVSGAASFFGRAGFVFLSGVLRRLFEEARQAERSGFVFGNNGILVAAAMHCLAADDLATVNRAGASDLALGDHQTVPHPRDRDIAK